MKEAVGNLWDLVGPDEVLVITTNGFVKADGRCVMGRGIAREARDRFKGIDRMLGDQIQRHGNHVTVMFSGLWAPYQIAAFPVKHHWAYEADIDLIRRSAGELVKLADRHHYSRVWMPRPGCGNGRLSWDDVGPVIAPLLDDRFIVVTFPAAATGPR